MKIKPLKLRSVSYFYLELVQNILVLCFYFGIFGYLNDKFLLLLTSYDTITELVQADTFFQILFYLQIIAGLIFLITLYRSYFPFGGSLKKQLAKISEKTLKILLRVAGVLFFLPYIYLLIF